MSGFPVRIRRFPRPPARWKRSYVCRYVTGDNWLEDAIQKADVLIEALGWIRRFRDKVTVIKLGGSVLDDEDALGHLLVDIVSLVFNPNVLQIHLVYDHMSNIRDINRV